MILEIISKKGSLLRQAPPEKIATFAMRLKRQKDWGLSYQRMPIKHTEKGKREINAENIEEFATIISRRKGDFLI